MIGEVAERLRAVASVLASGAGVLAELAETLGWAPQSGSIAEFDLEVKAVASDGTPWPDAAKGRIGEAVIGYAETAGGHMSSLSVLFSTGEVLYSVPALARSVLEHALKVCWILEPSREGDREKPMSTRDRFARAFLEELTSAEFYKKTVGRLSGKAGDPYTTVQRTWKNLRDEEIPALFGAEHVHLTRKPYQIGDETLLGLEDLDEWYSRNHVPGALRGVYDALSNFTHPTLFAVRELTKTVREGDTAMRGRDITVDCLERVATVPASSFYKMLEHVAAYFGWPRDTIETWSDMVNKWHPDLIHSVP